MNKVVMMAGILAVLLSGFVLQLVPDTDGSDFEMKLSSVADKLDLDVNDGRSVPESRFGSFEEMGFGKPPFGVYRNYYKDSTIVSDKFVEDNCTMKVTIL